MIANDFCVTTALIQNTFPEEPEGNFNRCGTCKISRVTSLAGLCMINIGEDFKFYY